MRGLSLFKFSVIYTSLISAVGCLTPNSVDLQKTKELVTEPATGDTTSFDQPAGAKAAKIIFKTGNPGGSFNGTTGSTTNIADQGHKAVRVFNPDGTLIPSWPDWFLSAEVTLSGTLNGAATNPYCARFAEATDATMKCDPNLDGVQDQSCGVPEEGFFRVSEADCAAGNTNEGTGNGYDGVALRFEFSRDPKKLGVHENLMAVLEYTASSIHRGPVNPDLCMKDGSFDPTNSGCTDMLWYAFMKKGPFDSLAPFSMFIPPAGNGLKTSTNGFGTVAQTKRMIIPLAANPDWKVLQLSRISGLKWDANSDFIKACAADPTDSSVASRSALCMGVVFYAITFFRI